MNEDLLQFVWQHKYLLQHTLKTSTGQELQVIKAGMLNRDSGPDFFNAQIKIDDMLWAGNVEIHIKSSDWYKHGHQTDPAYHNVILHVVWENDEVVFNHLSMEIPTLEMKRLINRQILDTYQELMLQQSDIPCKNIFIKPPEEILWLWLERLSTERLEYKYLQIMDLLKICKGHWEEVLYRLTAQCFGQKTNAGPFELLSGILPWSVWVKYRDQTVSFQALALGTAGFLMKPLQDSYNVLLQQEFNYLLKKHELKTVDVSIWKFGKTRPANFPTIRLFQFAELMQLRYGLFSAIIKCESYAELKKLFEINGNQKIDIGELHPLSKESHLERISLSQAMINSLLINVVVPITFSYGKYTQQEFLCRKAQEWLMDIPAEDNHILQLWSGLGIKCKKARESQALIQLKNYYCNTNRCLQCAIGNFLLRKEEVYSSP